MENETKCLNCGHPLQADDRFCPACGQKNKSSLVAVRVFLSDFFDQLFNLDNRIFRTLAALALPGQLTLAYFAGRRKPYYHPLRIFIVAAALMLALASILLKHSGLEEMNTRLEKQKMAFSKAQAYKHVDSLSAALKKEFSTVQVATALDSLNARLAAGNDLLGIDSIRITSGLTPPDPESPGTNRKVKVAVKDLLNLHEKELVNKYGITGFWPRLFFIQSLRTIKAGDQVVYYALGNVIWMLLLMMPLLALVLKLLYIRRGRYLVEHLVFALHSHAFLFLLIVLALLAGIYTHPGWVAIVSVSIAAFYIFLAIKRYYRQGWFKTLLKYAFTGFLYLFLLAFSTLLTAVLSMLLF